MFFLSERAADLDHYVNCLPLGDQSVETQIEDVI